MSDNLAISVRSTSKHFRDVRAVDGIDLEVRKGEIYGFLGRNGAGKTTTIRMLLGLIRPTSGEVAVLGTPITPGEQSVFSRVGYLVETATSYPNLTVRENLEIQRRLLKASPESVSRAIEEMHLGQYADRRARHLSLGNKQRLALARTLLHQPELLILDEPANGLDPAGIVEIRYLLRRLADERGVTVFLSSHVLSEIAQLADRIGIIHDGNMVEDLTREELHAKSNTYLSVRVSDADRALEILRDMLGVEGVRPAENGDLHLSVGGDRAPEIARLLVMSGLDLLQLSTEEEDLEHYFMRLTGGAS